MVEIAIRRQEGESATQTELSQECIDGAQLDSAASTLVSELGSLDVVDAIRDDHGESLEPIDQSFGCLGPTNSLQQLLKHQARRQNRLFLLQSLPET